jgi:nitroreductase
MELLKAISDRRAYRALSPEPLPEDAVRRIVEAGALAPSCYNNQPWRIVVRDVPVLTDGPQDGAPSLARGDALPPDALREALAEGNAWATRAPLIIAVAVRASDDCRLEDGRDYALFDAGLCAMNMMIQATAEGIVAHPIAGYNPKKAKAALGIPADYVLAVLIVVGKHGDPEAPDAPPLKEWQLKGETAPRQRKPLGEVAFKGRWGEPLA